MLGMIDGQRLKQAWDHNELGELLLGLPPYTYEPDAPESARFTRLRQVADFLRCRTAKERAAPVAQAIATLDASDQGFAKAAAIWLRQIFT